MQTGFKNSQSGPAMLVLIVCLTLAACQKKYGEPPILGKPDIVANISIKDLKAKYTGGQPVAITEELVIEGVVSCDDRSGNFYQQIALQDPTGGILIRLAGNNLFTNYPVGRQVFVKCKGLYLGQYNGTIQLGGGIDSAYLSQGGTTLLAVNLQPSHVLKGELNQTIIPQTVTISQLTTNIQDKYVNTVIRLVGFEFSSTDRYKTYADADQAGNRIIQDCAQNKITLRTSDFANFATLPVPQGNGEIIGVYSFFGSTKQFTIRDTTDVRFYGPRCPTPTGEGAITLGTTSPFTLSFDAIGTSGLPLGVYVKQESTASSPGNEGLVLSNSFGTKSLWNSTSQGFKNFASATGLTVSSNAAAQDASPNRALGVRQTGTALTGGDPGAAFVFQLANTTGKTNLKLDFLLQSLDGVSAAGRTTTWKVDYAFGDSPTSFTTVATNPATLTTAFGTFANTAVTVDFGPALNNNSQKVWIRIVALSNTTGGGNRASTGIDDVKISWN